MKKFTLPLCLFFVAPLLGQNGYITTVAGNGTTGTAGVGGPAASASLSAGMIAVDSSNNFYVTDQSNNRVVRVDAATGILTVVAGTGAASSTGDGGPAALATLNGPFAVVVDPLGNLYVSEAMGNRVRRIDASSGLITTYAGTGTGGWSGDGGPATAGTLFYPGGLALDAGGNLYIADIQNSRVRRVDASTGILTTVVGTGARAVAPDGTPASSASLALPMAVSFDPQGNLLITEAYAYRIRRVANGVLGTLAGNGTTTYNGDGEPAISAGIGMLASNVVADSLGNLYFADGLGRVRRIDAAGNIVTVAGSGAGAHLQVSTAAGGSGGGGSTTTTCPGNLGDFGPATLATLDGVIGLAFTSTGQLLMPDYIDCRVRAVTLPSPLLYTSATLALSGTTLTATITPIGGAAAPSGTVQFMQYESTGAPLPLASAPVSNGTATLDTSALPAGSYQLMALYSGDGAYNGSGSSAISVTGGGLPAPTFGATIPYPVLVSTPVTIPVIVTGSRGYGTGSITLYEGSTFLSTVSLVNGTGSFQFSSSITGTHQITVQFGGDSNYTPGSWTFPVTVLVTSTVSLTADKNPAAAGAAVTFTATVSPYTATGRVAFYDGGAFLGTATVVGGAAPFAISTLSVGAHSITATYNGDFVVAPATSGAFAETILTAASVALATSGSPSVYGQAVTLTAAVSPSTATGTVQFLDGGALLGASTLSGGSAQFTTAALTGGSHSITAAYTGDSADSPATSAPLAQTVSPATPTLTVTSMNNPTTVGGFVLFNMSITPRSPGAVLQVLDGTTVLATVTTSNTGAASYSTTALTAGFHSITASWAGDANVLAGTSPAYSEQIQAPTTESMTATGPVTFGQSVTLTATVSPATATGNVQFTDGGSNLGTVPLVNGAASVSYVPAMAGTHLAVATFIDPSNIYFANNANVTINVAKLTPVITVATSQNPSNVGQAVTLTSTLSAVPDGANVNFYDGATFIGVGTLASGTASMGYIFRTAGSHSVTANYSGNVNYANVTSAAVVQNVKTVTTTTLSAPATSTYGQSVSLVATVSASTATGTIQFLDGATPLGTVALASGSATLSLSTLAPGSHSLTAVYNGDTGDTSSTSAAATLTVSKASATAALATSPNPSVAGQAVTFTASVSPSSATGTVQFLDGSTVIGTVSLTSGAASLTAALAVGTHSITAVYSGDANYNGATSAAAVQTVNKNASTTALAASSGAVSFGQAVSFTASVSPASATGAVQFLDGATVIGAVALSSGSATLVVGNFAVGTHTITASYAGDGVTLASASGAVSVTVVKAASAVGIVSSLDPSLSGQAVTFTAVVSPVTTTGTVQFQDGGTVIGTVALTGGAASLTLTTLAAGSHSITAVYSGDANYNGAVSSALTQSVLIATHTNLSVSRTIANPGQNVRFTANISPSAATGTVSFLDGTTVLATVPVTSGSATFVDATLAAGAHTVTAVYSGASKYAPSTSSAVTVTIR